MSDAVPALVAAKRIQAGMINLQHERGIYAQAVDAEQDAGVVIERISEAVTELRQALDANHAFTRYEHIEAALKALTGGAE